MSGHEGARPSGPSLAGRQRKDRCRWCDCALPPPSTPRQHRGACPRRRRRPPGAFALPETHVRQSHRRTLDDAGPSPLSRRVRSRRHRLRTAKVPVASSARRVHLSVVARRFTTTNSLKHLARHTEGASAPHCNAVACWTRNENDGGDRRRSIRDLSRVRAISVSASTSPAVRADASGADRSLSPTPSPKRFWRARCRCRRRRELTRCERQDRCR